MAISIQFIGVENVLNAFNSRGAEFWSLWQGKQFLFKGVGADDLQTVLDSLVNSGTVAIYTLKVYDDVNDLSELKSKTECDGSFNFRINEIENKPVALNTEPLYRIAARLDEIEEKISGIETNDSDIEVKENNIVGSILGNPAVAALIPLLLEKLINYLSTDKTTSEKKNLIMNNEKTVLNGINIVEQLKIFDSDIENHLKVLLKIAQTRPDFFKVLIQNLEAYV